MHVERYVCDDAEEWDEFVRRSKNGTFLFERDYMEYHAHRFVDLSLLVRDDRGRLVAVLPGSQHDRTLVSHGGLTYGGFVSGTEMTMGRMLSVFAACLEHLHGEIDRIVYKPVPHIYHSVPAEEDAYALFVRGATLVSRDVSSAIDTRRPLPFRNRRDEAARRAGLRVERTEAFDRFWPVLEENLADRHGLKPVHTLREIQSLASRFPDNVLLFDCRADDEPVAGCVVYVTENVSHIQYTAASEPGRRLGAMDLVLASVIERFSPTHRWIDFGISTEDNGRYLNQGLAKYKERFGGRAINYDRYELLVP